MTRILTPLRSLRLLGLSVYNTIEENWFKFVNYLPTLFSDPLSMGMPEDASDLIFPPFKPYSFNTDKEKFYWYRFEEYLTYDHDNEFNDIFKFDNKFPARYKKVKDVMDIFTPINPLDSAKIPRVTWQGPDDNPLSFYIEPFFKMHFLPDNVEKFLYSWLGENYDHQIMHMLCADVAGYICVYGAIYTVIGFMRTSLISFNPYAWKPTAAILHLYEPWQDRLLHWLPKPYGIPMHQGLLFGTLRSVDFSLRRLVFTGPFLPSEGVFKTEVIGESQKVEAVYFHGFPTMWETATSIPNHERLYWWRHPEIYDYIIKTYHHVIDINNIVTLPDHIIQ